MDPNIWGPHAWTFLHNITLAYPKNPTESNKINIQKFIINMGHVLPCHKCKINFKDHLKDYPLTEKVISCRKELIEWLIDIHNCVNISNSKRVLSYTEALNECNLETWEESGWVFLHNITFVYPTEPTGSDKNIIKKFIIYMSRVLPCKKYRIIFKACLKEYPLTDKVLTSRKNLVEWLIDLHNQINLSNSKETLTYIETLNKYMKMKHK